MQSLPPVAAPAPAANPGPVAVPHGHVSLAVSARFGPDMPAINGGLHWRIFANKPEQNGVPRLVKEEKTAGPTFALPPGSYIVNVGFGLANVTKAVQLRSDTVREVFEIPAGGLRIEGRVGDAKIPPAQISFDLYKGSQFEPGDKRPIATSIMTGDVVLVPEGTYHIVSNYGDANATVRSDIRVQVGQAHRHHRQPSRRDHHAQAGQRSRRRGARQHAVVGADAGRRRDQGIDRCVSARDPGGGRIPRGRAQRQRTYERGFRVIAGVDGEIEVISR